ncbi:ABC transporter ATP-binding protein [Pseudonocardiaceae bacterium YIM PH 21723]|nr:ABC transporter ATP-binding protein [Pseudonocardiaceae bacterium YIM PH 21723]
MAAVEIAGLRVRRGGTVILDGITLSVPPGSLTALLGPSGSGKTTLLRSVVGAQRIAGGTVTVLGRPAGHPRLRREIGYTTQAASVYPDLSALENVRYHATLHGRDRQAATEALATTGLTKSAGQLVRTMSGGQVNRVSLACALVARPRLLLLDEPTVGLDPVLRNSLWDTFRQLAANGTTLVVSSHVMEEAARCDRVLLLRAGRLIADDSPEGLLRRTHTTGLDEAFLRIALGGAA